MPSKTIEDVFEELAEDAVTAVRERAAVKQELDKLRERQTKIKNVAAFESVEEAVNYQDILNWQPEAERRVKNLYEELVAAGMPTNLYIRYGEQAIKLTNSSPFITVQDWPKTYGPAKQ